jgi:ankyrin repeat protein
LCKLAAFAGTERTMALTRIQAATACLLTLLGGATLGARPVPPLIGAVRDANISAIRGLLQKGADVNVADVDGTTALHWAARLDTAAAADLLIQAGARPNTANRYGVTALSLAAANGSGGMIDRLLKAGADPSTTTADGETVLMTAARSGSVDGVRRLLARGADVGATERRRGTSALMWAAAADHAEIVRLLLEAGARVDERSRGDYSPLLMAVRSGSLDAVQVLLAAGANINDSAPAGDPNEPITIGFTSKRVPAFGPDDLGAVRTSALVLAMLNGRFTLATWLVNHGADPNVPDPRGSALHVLAWLRKAGLPLDSGPVRVTFGDPETFVLAQALLEHGANPNVRIAWKEIAFDKVGGQVRLPPNIRMGRAWLSYVGATPFWLAAKSSDVQLMRLLLAHGADAKIAAVQHVTPLMAAAGLGFWDAESPAPQNGTPETDTLEAVQICVELGADVNDTTQYGVIRVHGDPTELRSRYLFSEELPANGKAYGDMRWGEATALHGAALRGVNTVVKYLVDKGARLDARTTLGWTPLMVADHVFASNVERSWPETATYLRDLMKERGLAVEEAAAELGPTSAQTAR